MKYSVVPEIWPISTKRAGLKKLLQYPLEECAKQGENINRPGQNHAWTCRSPVDLFVKAVNVNAPTSTRNIKDHYIQNALALLKKRGVLNLDIHFPITVLAVANVGPEKIKKFRLIHSQINAEIKLLVEEQLNSNDKKMLSSKYKNLNFNDLPSTLNTILQHYQSKAELLNFTVDLLFDMLVKKSEQLGKNLAINEGIEARLNPNHKNKKYIAFVMEDVNRMPFTQQPRRGKEVEPSENRSKLISDLNQWLKNNLGLYHWDSENGRNTMIKDDHIALIDPAFTVEADNFKANIKKLLNQS
jgi:hypothetical protein